MRHYDLVFSIGARCVCSQALREANLQFSSFPFDWVAQSSFDRRVRLLVEDFSGWLSAETLVKKPSNNTLGVELYCENSETGMLFVHDFVKGKDIESQIEKVNAKYARRAERLLSKISSSKRVLIAWVNTFDECLEADDAKRATEVLHKKWPEVSFDFVIFKDVPNISYKEARIEETDNVRVVSMDYHDPRQAKRSPLYNNVAKWLKREYTATDYRTEEDKKTFKSYLAKHEYARYAATGWFDHLITKCSYKLYKHLHKRLARKGLI